jgi:hypothetical protein
VRQASGGWGARRGGKSRAGTKRRMEALTTVYLKMGLQPTPEMLCIKNRPIFSVAVQSLKDLGRLTYRRFLELFKHMLGLLGRVISPSQGLYLHRTTQHRKTRTHIHALSRIRTYDPSNQRTKTHASDHTATVTGKTGLYLTKIDISKHNIRINDQLPNLFSSVFLSKLMPLVPTFLTPWSRVLLEKLLVCSASQEIPRL